MKKAILVLAMCVMSIPAWAQRWEWPDHAKNLKVLPATTNGKELQRVMYSFANGLGVRCGYCHVEQEGKGFGEPDFASDAKPEKDKARLMMQMVKAINGEYLSKLGMDSTSSLKVSCITCHHGNAVPILLEDKLKKTFDLHGIDSTISQYQALRTQYYGGFTYNFKEGTLVQLADEISEDTTQLAAAATILKLNIQLYPDFSYSYARLGGIYEKEGNTQGAIDNYSQAIKLDPRNGMARRELERLQGSKK
ncbi:MAG TPA: c-type cytochrome [Bacteroidota bacterium]|nr:c-type cytochrome [Bacteroidota bacterium]